MQVREDANSVYTPMIVHLHLKESTELRRKARVEWLEVRDHLTVEQNAQYLDSFRALDDQNRRLRDMLEPYKDQIQAELN